MSHKLILMVGPPGSGKTTYSSRVEDYLRISQDEEGRFGHMDLFLNCLRNGESVIIDRMNFNKSQRKPYISRAKTHGYKVEIVVLEEIYDVCLRRCLERTDHPTLKTEKEIFSALTTFYKEYERPEYGEADALTFLIKNDETLKRRKNMTKLEKYEGLAAQGYLRKVEKGDLVLFNYTDKCTFERNWNEETMEARGIILDKYTGNVAAKTMSKFFNLGETDQTFYKNLPNEPYKVYEKYDGSAGTIFYYDGQWQVATRGSFSSDQAIKATEMLKKYDLESVPKYLTLIVEIIYPENKIVVNYGQEEKLVLLSVFNALTGKEIAGKDLESYATITGMEMAKSYDYTIEQMIDLQKTLTKDQEGFVVRFESGLRVKIKGDEYMRIAKLLSRLSPLSLWECMDLGVVKTEYLAQLPEELRSEFEPIVKQLERSYEKLSLEVAEDYYKLPVDPKEDHKSADVRKRVGLFIKNSDIIKHKAAMFPFLFGQTKLVDNYIMDKIRPDGNEMVEL